MKRRARAREDQTRDSLGESVALYRASKAQEEEMLGFIPGDAWRIVYSSSLPRRLLLFQEESMFMRLG